MGGWVAAQRYGKLRVRLSLCAQVCTAATLFKGRATRFFRQNRAKKPKISAKAGIFGGNQAGLEWKCAVGGWVTAQGYGKLRVRLSLCVQVCTAAVAFALQLGAAGRYAEMRKIAGAAVGLYVGGHGRCFCF